MEIRFRGWWIRTHLQGIEPNLIQTNELLPRHHWRPSHSLLWGDVLFARETYTSATCSIRSFIVFTQPTATAAWKTNPKTPWCIQEYGGDVWISTPASTNFCTYSIFPSIHTMCKNITSTRSQGSTDKPSSNRHRIIGSHILSTTVPLKASANSVWWQKINVPYKFIFGSRSRPIPEITSGGLHDDTIIHSENIGASVNFISEYLVKGPTTSMIHVYISSVRHE